MIIESDNAKIQESVRCRAKREKKRAKKER